MVTLAGAVSANQMDIAAHFYDTTPQDTTTLIRGGVQTALSNNTTDVTIVATPGVQGRIRNVHTLSINNKDTATATVTVKLDDNGVQKVLVKQSIAAGESLTYEDKAGWTILSPITPPFIDTTDLVKGSLDSTKHLRIEVDGITTGTTRVWTVADADIMPCGHATGLTNTRVPYVSGTTGGVLTDSANMVFDGTKLTVNTLGAFTLAGTIAGGGNQLNNIIIGTSTPLAGSFTTLGVSSLQTNTAGILSEATNLATSPFRARYNSVNSPMDVLIGNSNGFVALGWNTTPVAGTDTPNYALNGFASSLRGHGGQFSFFTAASGTAGNPITLLEQVRINHTASATRYLTLTGSNGGNPTIDVSAGSLAITPAVAMASTLTSGQITATGNVTTTGASSGIVINRRDTSGTAVQLYSSAGNLNIYDQVNGFDAFSLNFAASSNRGFIFTTSNGANPTITTTAGGLTITPATTLSAALTYGGVTLSNAVTGTGNMVLSATPTFTGAPVSTTAAVGTNTTQIATTAFVSAFPQPITNTLTGDVALNNTGNFFDGPSVAQGTSGTWGAMGQVTCTDTAGAARFIAKLWDGTTLIAAGEGRIAGANQNVTISLSGYLASPAGNLRISVNGITATTGAIKFNSTGLSKDSTITAFKVAN